MNTAATSRPHARTAGRIAATLLALLASVWVTMAFGYQAPGGPAGRAIAIAAWLALAAAVVRSVWQGRTPRGMAWLGAGLLAVAGWWSSIAPSATRPWADDVSRFPVARVDGSVVTLQNVRNFDWRSDDDYTVRWDTRRYDLNRLASVDMAASYWMGPAIAHTLVSFGFDDGRFLTFSIEIRKERGESFSAIGGFFKKFETGLVAADERDILGVRTTVRGEDVYLYRIGMAPEARRSLFLAYLDEADSLSRRPRFYNTLTANCTTIIFEMARRIVPGLPLDWRLLASGYVPGYLQDVGALAPGYSLQALREGGRITERAQPALLAPDFSAAIRQGVPGVASPSEATATPRLAPGSPTSPAPAAKRSP